jgi:hypothetical protein
MSLLVRAAVILLLSTIAISADQTPSTVSHAYDAPCTFPENTNAAALLQQFGRVANATTGHIIAPVALRFNTAGNRVSFSAVTQSIGADHVAAFVVACTFEHEFLGWCVAAPWHMGDDDESPAQVLQRLRPQPVSQGGEGFHFYLSTADASALVGSRKRTSYLECATSGAGVEAARLRFRGGGCDVACQSAFGLNVTELVFLSAEGVASWSDGAAQGQWSGASPDFDTEERRDDAVTALLWRWRAGPLAWLFHSAARWLWLVVTTKLSPHLKTA